MNKSKTKGEIVDRKLCKWVYGPTFDCAGNVRGAKWHAIPVDAKNDRILIAYIPKTLKNTPL